MVDKELVHLECITLGEKRNQAMFCQILQCPPHHPEVESILNLVISKNTLLISGTGCGKACISELFFQIISNRWSWF